jgi:uncharacterized membrane protein
MGKDVSDVIGTALGNAAREAIQGVSTKARKGSDGSSPLKKGLAAGAVGAGLMALAPAASKGVGKLVSGAGDGVGSVGDLKDAGVGKLKDASVGKLKDAGADALKEATGKAKDDVIDSIPGSGLFGKDKDKKSGGAPGVPKGRRMPVQQDFDIGVPVSVVYNQWTQFEEWPKFMHRVQSASQEDESHVSFKTKIWGKTKDFKAEIVEQRPEERIEWKVTEGPTHTGVVTFHELGPRLTRLEVNLDFEPGSMIEKAARGMRFVKRAVRADMARFKSYVIMQEEETGAWRGEIQDGEVKKKSSSSEKSSSSQKSSSSEGSRSTGSRSSSDGKSRSSANGRSRSSSSGRRGGSSNGRSSSSGGRTRAASGSRRRSGSSS